MGSAPKADARGTPILIEEINARLLEGTLDDVQGCSPRLTRPGFQLVDCYQANARFCCEILLAPVQQSTRGSALRRGDHVGTMAIPSHFYKYDEKLMPTKA